MVNKMAKPTKVGAKWLARIRRKGYPEQSAVFSTKILAEKWQRGIEAQIDQQRAGNEAFGLSVPLPDGCSLEELTVTGVPAERLTPRLSPMICLSSIRTGIL